MSLGALAFKIPNIANVDARLDDGKIIIEKWNPGLGPEPSPEDLVKWQGEYESHVASRLTLSAEETADAIEALTEKLRQIDGETLDTSKFEALKGRVSR